MISLEDIEGIEPPECPVCEAEMSTDHSKTWGGRSWHYHKIVFVCNKERSHYLRYEARSVEEYESTILGIIDCG